MDFGPVRRWRDGDILYAENDFILGAYVVSDDPEKIGTLGWHKNAAGDEICVEYIKTGKLWEDATSTSEAAPSPQRSTES